MKFFDNPLTQTIAIPLHPVDGSGTNAMEFTGPPGARGLLRQLSCVVINDIVTGASLVRLGITGTLAAFASLTVPVSAGGTFVQLGKEDMNNNYITPDTIILLNDDGIASAGDVSIICVIDWERLGRR